MVITPTVGRIVWYTPAINAAEDAVRGDQPFAALVIYVWNERLVNLVTFDHAGIMHARTSVQLVQEGDEKPGGGFCEWMPYQLGQAKAAQPIAPVKPVKSGATG